MSGTGLVAKLDPARNKTAGFLALVRELDFLCLQFGYTKPQPFYFSLGGSNGMAALDGFRHFGVGKFCFGQSGGG